MGLGDTVIVICIAFSWVVPIIAILIPAYTDHWLRSRGIEADECWRLFWFTLGWAILAGVAWIWFPNDGGYEPATVGGIGDLIFFFWWTLLGLPAYPTLLVILCRIFVCWLKERRCRRELAKRRQPGSHIEQI